MHLDELAPEQRCERLASGLAFRVGPFNLAVGTSHAGSASLSEQLHAVYPRYKLAGEEEFVHAGVTVEMARRSGGGAIRLDDGQPFTDFPADHALPYIEWGLNWCIATRCHYFLMLHAAALERDGRALILPGLPGAGKSTLSAYLMHNGWRLLSDEFTLVRPGTVQVTPFPRLVPLKNESVDVIAAAVPAARIGPRFDGTRKGTVAHVTPLSEHATATHTATAVMVVKPQFITGGGTELREMPKGQAFVELSKNAFNYQVLGQDGFETVAAIADCCTTHTLAYGNLHEAASLLDELMTPAGASGA